MTPPLTVRSDDSPTFGRSVRVWWVGHRWNKGLSVGSQIKNVPIQNAESQCAAAEVKYSGRSVEAERSAYAVIYFWR